MFVVRRKRVYVTVLKNVIIGKERYILNEELNSRQEHY